MLENLITAPSDPILGLGERYLTDERIKKINLSVGVYKDETAQTPVLESVKKAESFLLENEESKSYLAIDGLPEFNRATEILLLGQENDRVKTAQAPGGTGALRIMADFLAHKNQIKRVWISNPTWPNHLNLFQNLGVEVAQYHYYNAAEHCLDFERMMDDLSHVVAGEAVLFHGCCHNPTGIDPTPEQWQEISDLALKNGWLPLFDIAYQGFGHGLDEDAYSVRLFAESQPELLIASSYSKNFSLYNERIGAFTLIAADAEIANRAFSQVKTVIRSNYSNPPAHGAKVVSYILNSPDLKEEWIDELKKMRERIHRMRQLFVKTLQEKGNNCDFNFITKQNGLFSFSGLTEEQVLRLRDEYGIYIVDSGRINIAGMTLDNMSFLCESIVKVL